MYHINSLTVDGYRFNAFGIFFKIELQWLNALFIVEGKRFFGNDVRCFIGRDIEVEGLLNITDMCCPIIGEAAGHAWFQG
jgi:hypothetical protein